MGPENLVFFVAAELARLLAQTVLAAKKHQIFWPAGV
jgi:hypothetical protein